MLIPVVDENDVLIEYKERDALAPNDIFRITALVIFDENKRVLLTRRVLTKKKSPGKRSLAVAGTVEKGESYEDNIRKETREEIGVELAEVKELLYSKENANSTYFAKTYITTFPHDTKFVFDPSEIMDYKWETIEAIDEIVSNTPEVLTSSLCRHRPAIRQHIEL